MEGAFLRRTTLSHYFGDFNRPKVKPSTGDNKVILRVDIPSTLLKASKEIYLSWIDADGIVCLGWEGSLEEWR